MLLFRNVFYFDGIWIHLIENGSVDDWFLMRYGRIQTSNPIWLPIYIGTHVLVNYFELNQLKSLPI